MKECIGCKHAKWQLTAEGKLDPRGGGECLHAYQLPPLPNSMAWMNGVPIPSGGSICRLLDLYEGCCPYYKVKNETKAT